MKTIPYATVDDRRIRPFTEDLELASIFTMAEIRRKKAPLNSMVRVYYPFHVRSWEGNSLLIDMLGISRASIKYRNIPDITGFDSALKSASDDPDAFRDAMEREGGIFKKSAGQRTINIKGLIARPEVAGELSSLLNNTDNLGARKKPFIFKPVLTKSDVRSIIKQICSIRDDIESDMKTLEGTTQRLMEAFAKTRKTLEERIQDTKDRSSEVKVRIKTEFEAAKKKINEALKQQIAEIKNRYREMIAPLTRERNNIRGRLKRQREKIEETRSEEEPSIEGPTEEEEVPKEIQDLQNILREIESAISALTAKRDLEEKEERAKHRSEIKAEGEKLKEHESTTQRAVKKIIDEISDLESGTKGVTKKIDRLIQLKKKKLNSLSRLSLNLQVENTDLYVPFYIFNYGEKNFDFYAPIVATSAKGFLSRFRRMLADNLQEKMTQLIKPRINFIERYLERAAKALSKRGDLSTAYRSAGNMLNLLRSRQAVDNIMIGLVKIRKEGWISDSEYIMLQDNLVEKLGLITYP